MIFQRLGTRTLGFGELRRAMAGVTTKVLRQQLRELEGDGLVTRSPAVPRQNSIRAENGAIRPCHGGQSTCIRP